MTDVSCGAAAGTLLLAAPLDTHRGLHRNGCGQRATAPHTGSAAAPSRRRPRSGRPQPEAGGDLCRQQAHRDLLPLAVVSVGQPWWLATTHPLRPRKADGGGSPRCLRQRATHTCLVATEQRRRDAVAQAAGPGVHSHGKDDLPGRRAGATRGLVALQRLGADGTTPLVRQPLSATNAGPAAGGAQVRSSKLMDAKE
jgi:hypothetical protein